MSMHEFEDLVEQSVRLLDASPRAQELDLRSLFWNLYEFQGRYDTGFTHFRVIDLLVKHRFAYAFDPEEHPDAARLGDRFRLDYGSLQICRHPMHLWDAEVNPVVGYICDPIAEWGEAYAATLPVDLQRLRLYCDAGSELWHRFVELGKLVGPDALPPKKIPLDEVAIVVVREAERKRDRELVRMWFTLLFVDFMSEKLQTLQERPAVLELRAIARRLSVLDTTKNDESLRRPSEEDLAELSAGVWWFALDRD